MNDFNILFTCVGRRVSVIRHFRRALNELGLKGKIVGTEITELSPAFQIIDKGYLVCRISDDDYIPTLLDICAKEKIKLLISLLDTDLLKIASHKNELSAIGTTALISDPQVIEIASDKIKTHNFFISHGIGTPRLLEMQNLLDDKIGYPVFMKPADGSSSVGAHIVRNKKELLFLHEITSNPIQLEYMEGEEYTLDVLVDFEGNVKCVVPRLRIEVRSGEVSKGMTVKNQRIINAGRDVVEKLRGCMGPITLQCFLTRNGEIKFIEINPRFGGGHPLAIKAGADFPKWIIQMTLGQPLKISIDSFRDGIIMLRYDEEIFIEKQISETKKEPTYFDKTRSL